ncbi:MAG TPA: iron-containing alcohol dehydrogenase [Clostridia bacterium]|nr:iron-containing alcohol dehydrogenase [Clostridia bacterium]
MYKSFTFKTPSIVFGMDAINQVGIEAKKLNAKRVLFLTGPNVKKAGHGERVMSLLKDEQIETELSILERSTPEPTTDIAENTAKLARELKVDLIIGMGGGSIIDVAKMSAALLNNPLKVRDYFGKEKLPNRGIPTIMIPTTSGTGAEVTKHAIFLDEENGVKKAVASSNLLPDTAIIDPLLTVSCPAKVTASSGMDAFLHAAEPFLSKEANLLTDCIALKAIRLISKWIGPAFANGEDMEARYYMSLGSLMAGLVLNNSGTSLVHALAYPIGGEYHVPHGPSLTCILNSCLNYIKVAKQERLAMIAEAMGERIEGLSEREAAQLAIDAIRNLLVKLGLPTSLTDLNITDKSKVGKWAIDGYAEQRLLSRSPRVLSVEDIKTIYENAF